VFEVKVRDKKKKEEVKKFLSSLLNCTEKCKKVCIWKIYVLCNFKIWTALFGEV